MSERRKPLPDKQLLDWLDQRRYVEATDAGNEDPQRFEWHGEGAFREELSAHVRGEKRTDRFEGARMVTLDELRGASHE